MSSGIVSEVAPTVAGMHGDRPINHTDALHHPWRAFRELVGWTLRWAHLPDDAWGETCFRTRTVTLSPDLNQAERRCTIAHETQHILRGPAPAGGEGLEERLVDRNAARLLLPDIHAIGDALAWVGWRDVHAAADELWVDEYILQARLDALHPAEKGYLRTRFAADADGRGA